MHSYRRWKVDLLGVEPEKLKPRAKPGGKLELAVADKRMCNKIHFSAKLSRTKLEKKIACFTNERADVDLGWAAAMVACLTPGGSDFAPAVKMNQLKLKGINTYQNPIKIHQDTHYNIEYYF